MFLQFILIKSYLDEEERDYEKRPLPSLGHQMPHWKIAWLLGGICRLLREKPLYQVNEDRITKKIICRYFIELWYTLRVWKLDFPKPAVL